jgi:hypothetical protein
MLVEFCDYLNLTTTLRIRRDICLIDYIITWATYGNAKARMHLEGEAL